MASTSLSQKGFAYALLAIVGIIVLYLFGFSRGLTEVTRASQERANNEATIAALKQKITDLRSLEQQFAASLSDVNALSVAMPADKQLAELVTMLETMAARSGIVLENVQPQDATIEGVPLVVTVRGDFGAILTFVEIIEKNVRPFTIGPINIASGDNELSTTFDLTALYQVPTSDLPAEAAPGEGTP